MKEMDDGGKYCYLHPEEVFVGVCPSCLYERLFLLANSKPKRGHNHYRKQQQQQQKHSNNNSSSNSNKPLLIILPRVLFSGFGARNHRKSRSYHTDASSPPQLQDQDQEDSFISIRFEKNGVCAWDKGNKVASSHKVSMEHCNISSGKHKEEANSNTRVVEHPKPQASLRWRKRIGQLFQLARWRRSYKANSKLEGVKVKVRNY